MDSTTIILIIVSIITALLLALFQYVYKEGFVGLKKWVLVGLRSLSIFCILLLLINPKFEQVDFNDVKPKLVVALDNSKSMKYLELEDALINISKEFESNQELNKKFDLEFYKFGTDIEKLDELDLEDPKTDYYNLIKSYQNIYSEDVAPMVLISDGNQTFGREASFFKSTDRHKIYPLILGDTTAYEDLELNRVNHNKYVFYKNKFELEVLVRYSGLSAIRTRLKVFRGNQEVFTRTLEFNDSNSSELINVVLEANRLGIQSYRVIVEGIENEQNLINNSKEFAIEVIDQKTKVALVYSTPHPDLGAIRKAVSSNEQQEISLLKPKEYLSSEEDFQLVVLYQPDASFSSVLKQVYDSGINTWLISGSFTDWEVINKSQSLYQQEITYQEELYEPILNPAFSPFIIGEFSFEDYPPLVSEFGTISFNYNVDNAIFKSVNGNETGFPLLSTMESNNEKHGILFGEGLWRWRSQDFINNGDFSNFDGFLGKLIQYLSSNKRRQRLVTSYENIYNSTDEIVLVAQYFNKSYELDTSANLELNIGKSDEETTKRYPMLYGTSGYEVDLSGLSSGNYEFEVSNAAERISQSGQFQVVAFDIEQQFISPNKERLALIAEGSNTNLYDFNTVSQLIDDLVNSNDYPIVRVENRNILPLIDWYYLLVLFALAVSLEWFIRKYNGLI